MENKVRHEFSFILSNDHLFFFPGEVGSGKSSAINLILDCQLLPTDALRCTNTIVEIRCSDRKEAVCYFGSLTDTLDRVRKISPKVINISKYIY